MRIGVYLLGALALSALAMYSASLARYTSQDHADALLEELTEAERAKLILPFESENRMAFAYTPGTRPGLSLKELDENKRRAVLALLRAGISEVGFRKAEEIRTQIEPVLRDLEGGNSRRDLELYYLTFFGKPSKQGAWGWRYEGHHLSLNFTYRDGKLISTSPQFLGSNPAEVPSGPLKGKRVLAQEEDLGRRLATSLTQEQREKAILSQRAPSDILTSNQRQASIEDNRGIPFSELTDSQQAILKEIVQTYADIQSPDQAAVRLKKIEEAGWGNIRFAWMGSTSRGEGHYYRVQGTTFLIEYDNTQNRANHIHTVWRDFKGDWGRDALAEHYRSSSHHRGQH